MADLNDLLTTEKTNNRALRHSGFTSTVTDSFSTPESNPQGISWDGTNTLHADNNQGEFFTLSGFSSTILDSFSTPSDNAHGVSSDAGGDTYASAQATDQYFHLSGFTATVQDSFLHNSPAAVEWGGTDIFSTNRDQESRRIQFSGFSSTIKDSDQFRSTPEGWGFGIGSGSPRDMYYVENDEDRFFRVSGMGGFIRDSFAIADVNRHGVTWSEPSARGFNGGNGGEAPAFGDGNLVVCDNSAQEVERYSGFSNTQVASFAPQGNTLNDLTTAPDDDVVVVIDTAGQDVDSEVYRHSGFSTTVVDSNTATISGDEPFAVTWRDGDGHIAANGVNPATFAQFSGFTETITDSFSHEDWAFGLEFHSGDLYGAIRDQINTTGEEETAVQFSGFTSTIQNSFKAPAGHSGFWNGISWTSTGVLIADEGDPQVEQYSGFSSTLVDCTGGITNVRGVVWDNYSVRTASTTEPDSDVKYRAEFENHNRTWRVDITTPDFSGDTSTRFVQEGIRIVWGEPGSKEPSQMLPSYVRIQMDDLDGSLFDDINSRPDHELTVRIYSTDGEYDWNGECRTDTVSRVINPGTDLPIVDFYAYDAVKGQSEESFPLDQTAADTEDPIGTEVLKTILVDGAQGLDMEIVHSWFAVNAGPNQNQLDGIALATHARQDQLGDRDASEIFATTQSGASAGDSRIEVDTIDIFKPGQSVTLGTIDGSEFEVLTVEQVRMEGDDQDLYVYFTSSLSNDHTADEPLKPFYLQSRLAHPFFDEGANNLNDLEDLAAQYGLRVWEAADGVWRVMRDVAIGEEIPTGPENLLYDQDADSLSEAVSAIPADQPAVTDDDWERQSTRTVLRKILEATVTQNPAGGDENVVLDADIESEHGIGSIDSRWLILDPKVTKVEDAASTGEASMLVDGVDFDTGTVRQYLQWVSPQVDEIDLNVYLANAVTGLSGPNEFRLYVWGRDGTKWYVDADGSWKSSETGIPLSDVGPFDPGLQATIESSPPISGLLVLEVESDDANGLLVDDVRIRPSTIINHRDSGASDGRKLEIDTKFVNTTGARQMALGDDGRWDQVAGWYPRADGWLKGTVTDDLTVDVLAVATGPNNTGQVGSAYRHSGFSPTVTDSFSTQGEDSVDLEFDGDDTLIAVHSAGGDSDPAGEGNVLSTIQGRTEGATSVPSEENLLTATGAGGATQAGQTDNLLSLDALNDAVRKHSAFSATVTDSFSSPGAEPQGMVWTMADAITADTSGTIYRHSGFSATTDDSLSSPLDSPGGLSWNGIGLLSADETGNSHFQHSGFTGTITDSYSTPQSSPYGIEWDDESERQERVLSGSTHRKHSGFTSTIQDSYSAPMDDPAGLVWSEDMVFSLDIDGRVFRHDGFSATTTISFSTPGDQSEGISKLGADLLTEDGGTGKHYRHSGVTNTLIDSYTTPQSSPFGLEWDNEAERLDSSVGSIKGTHLQHSGFSDTIDDSYSSPGNRPTGITWNGSSVISADSAANSHFRHSGFSNTIDDSYSYVSDDPEDIDWDGEDVLSVDGNLGNAVKHSGFSATVKDSFSAPGMAPSGISYNKGQHYTADQANNSHYRHSGFSTTVLDSYSAPQLNPGGLSWEGNDVIWVSLDTEDHYKQSGFSATVVDSYSGPGESAYGISTDALGDRVATPSTDGIIFKHSAFSGTVTDSFVTPGPHPSGVSEDGDVFTTDSDNDFESFYRHSGFSATVTDSFSFSDNSALSHDGEHLLSVKFTDLIVRRHSGFSDTVIDSFTAPQFMTLIDGVGMWGDNTLLYDEGADSHFRMSGFTSSVTDSYSTPYERGAGLTVDRKDVRKGDQIVEFSYSTGTGLDDLELREIVIDPMTSRVEKATVKSFTADTIEIFRPLEQGHPQGAEIRPVFQDLTELRLENTFRQYDANREIIEGELWGLYPPESTPTYDGKTWVVAGGVELHLRDEITRGTWVEKPFTFG